MTIQAAKPRLTPAPMFNELQIVRLTQDIATPDGPVPKGTLATILQVFANGTAYQVEFEGPHEAPETIPASALEAA